jgi:hypothetical protein
MRSAEYYEGVGCVTIVVALTIACALASIVHAIYPDQRMENCIESCGPTRTAVYQYGNCTCGGEP